MWKKFHKQKGYICMRDKWTDIKCDWKIGKNNRRVINIPTPVKEINGAAEETEWE